MTQIYCISLFSQKQSYYAYLYHYQRRLGFDGIFQEQLNVIVVSVHFALAIIS